jgi:membrane-associated phospholipid phosphatase
VLYPQLRAWFDEAYLRFATSSPQTLALTNGLSLGRLIGALAVDSRNSDGSSTQVTYIPGNEPGDWRRTGPFFRPPLDPHWRYVEPFCLVDIEPYVPPGPPPLNSAAYAEDLNQVKALGAKNSDVRTVEQSESAVFWSDFSYTVTPPGHWQQIATTIARTEGHTLAETARLLALLSLAQADAGIVTWEAKYRYNFWRPMTAIQRAEEDGNPKTEPDAAWESLLVTPPFPEYTSGHSTFSAASAAVISSFFGKDEMAFTVGSDSRPGVYRGFTSLAACADEIGISRIFGGIHFSSANRDGKTVGSRIGRFVVDNFLLSNQRLPLVWLESVNQSSCRLRVHGHVGSNCVIEASSDFASWQPVATNRAVVGGFVIENSSSGSGTQFYRVREE